MVFQEDLVFNTTGNGDMHCLDRDLEELIIQSGIRNGLVHVFNIGSTGTVCMIEYEPGLEKDLPEILNKLIPPGRHYGHELAWQDGNAHSHLQASIVGPEMTLPLQNGILQKGTWQQIIHLECDNKPRQRVVKVTIYGE